MTYATLDTDRLKIYRRAVQAGYFSDWSDPHERYGRTMPPLSQADPLVGSNSHVVSQVCPSTESTLA